MTGEGRREWVHGKPPQGGGHTNCGQRYRTAAGVGGGGEDETRLLLDLHGQLRGHGDLGVMDE